MAEIMIRELSIGDWVRHTVYDDNLQIKRIDGESERLLVEKGLMSVSCHLDHFEPIPLTPGILEKNGFVKWQGGLVLIGDEISCRYEDGNLSIEQGYRDNEGELVERRLVNIECLSVHQLQHALRLAGEGKEIEV